MFDIGTNTTRVGVLTYNTDVVEEIGLEDFSNKGDLLTAISNIRQRGGYNTHTFEAIRFMRRRMLRNTADKRDNAAKIGIIVTDGQSSNVLLTVWEAAKTKRKGIRLFAIGIGGNTNSRELQGIASKPESDHVFEINNFDALESIRQILAVRTCEGTKIISLNNPTSIVITIVILMIFLSERFMKVTCNIKHLIYNKEFSIPLVCFNKAGKGLRIKMMVTINNRKN